MSDIRSQSGKLIYDLTSAEALTDTDIIPISTNYLTRSITLSQLKLYTNAGIYTSQEVDELIDNLVNDKIALINKDIFDLRNDITEFRNEFITKLSELSEDLFEEVNNIDQRVTDLTNDLRADLTDLETRFNEKIIIGNQVPTTLKPGQVYLQYF